MIKPNESLDYSHVVSLTETIDPGLLCFHWSAPEQTVEETVEIKVILDAIALIVTSL